MNRSTSYQYLIDTLGKEKLENRFLFLISSAKSFINDRNIHDYIYINKQILNNTVIDYFADIVRLKDFHNIDVANRIKIASYLSFWINRRKPLQILTETGPEIIGKKPYLDNINEWFACFIITSVIFDTMKPIEYGVELTGDKSIYRHHHFISTLAYNFTYRTVTPHSIELSLMGLITKVGYEFK